MTCWWQRDGWVPAPGLCGIVFETLFGPLASTGLRIGEALALRNVDVDLKTGMLAVSLRDDLNNPPLNRVGAIQLSDREIAASNL